ncbi:MAG TPA: L,D-transpeptidase family protein, partial [Gammaproteobacteria bacterium]|nr:L,D-transpeptidase family protein [Gammaproteobacteria bacterium]
GADLARSGAFTARPGGVKRRLLAVRANLAILRGMPPSQTRNLSVTERLSFRKRASLAAALSYLALALAGCAFMPPAETAHDAALAAAPDPSAPRLPPLDTSRVSVDPKAELVGQMQVLFARYENTFSAIARVYDVGYEAVRHANPGVDAWLPGEGTPVYLPTRSILPDAPRDGIVVNLPAMRLFYFRREPAKDGEGARLSITSRPIGIGREGWETPIGEAKVTQKVRDPVWYPPASVRKEHAENGDPLPAIVPAGPDNPLGRHALLLSLPGYLIHGTNKPAGVGMRVSHGCIRLYPEDIAALFDAVPVGTHVTIVNQPALAGWADGELYLEVHPPLEDDRDLAADAESAIAAAIERAGLPDVALNRAAIERVVAERRGIPMPVGNTSRTLVEYLAASRIVDNTVPLPQTAATAEN